MDKTPYSFEVDTQRLIAYYSTTQPKFYAAIGRHVDVERLSDPVSQTIIKQVHHLTKTGHSSPSSIVTVKQRLFDMYNGTGDLSAKDYKQCKKLLHNLAEMEKSGELDMTWQALIEATKHTIKRALKQEFAYGASDVYANDGEVDELAKIQRTIDQVGEVQKEESFGLATMLERVKNYTHGVPIDAGIPNLDAENFRLCRGNFGCAMADTGGGKTTFLVHVGATALIQNLNVCYLSFEDSADRLAAKFLGTMAGVNYNEILQHAPDAMEQAEKVHKAITVEGVVRGKLHVEKFKPHTMTVQQLISYVRGREREDRITYDMVIVDYADKVTTKSHKNSTYMAMEEVYAGLQSYAIDDEKYIWTASQVQRNAVKNEDIDNLKLDHVADSKNKIRNLDMIVSLNVNKDRSDIRIGVLKNRGGDVTVALDPVPCRFAQSMITDRQDKWMFLKDEAEGFEF